MKKTILFALLSSGTAVTAALAFAGCSSTNSSTAGDGGSDSSLEDSPTGDTGPAGDSGNPTGDSGPTGDAADSAAPPPAPPALGTLIDRMGRPAINTALNSTFALAAGADGGAVTCEAPGLCPAKDQYNQDGTPSDWSTNWAQPFFLSLAILDSLDNVCGNQAGYNATLGGTNYPAYTALAGLFSQDALWLNTSGTVCNQYLGVELNTLGIANTDCGGRTLTENTIDETYQLLSGQFAVIADAGAGGGVGPSSTIVTNGITTPAKAPTSTFPYFASPN
jgi:hypothetical protein